MINYTTPGVFIEEIPATGPIAGVGTSTVAFVGPTLNGPINTPTSITNWTQFKSLFGDYALDPTKRIFTPYAVSGFFSNGGTTAYMVRVGTAQTATLPLNDRANAGSKATLVITALRPGLIGNSIQVTVQNAQIVDSTKNAAVQKARVAIASATSNTVTVTNATDAALFRVGDTIAIDTVSGATTTTTERAQIVLIQGTQLTLGNNLTTTYTPASPPNIFVRIADLQKNQKTFRIQNSTGIESGSIINLAQGATSESCVVDSMVNSFVTLTGTGLVNNAYTLGASDAAVTITTTEFSLAFSQSSAQPPVSESFSNLSLNARHSRYFARIVNSSLVTVALPATPNTQFPPTNLPIVPNTALLTGGSDDSALTETHYLNALTSLTTIKDVQLVCLSFPDGFNTATVKAIQADAVTHCQSLGDRFAILDAAQNSTISGSTGVLTQVGALTSPRGFAAFYYPWVQVNDPAGPTGNETLLVPPSGHLAGIYARSDAQRGVHKAPANEFIAGVQSLQTLLSDTDQGQLNTAGINALRIFPNQPPIVWGARSTAPLDQVAWRYINVRRLFIFIEQSLIEGLRWAVFEPNDPTLWKKLKRTTSEFLTRVWSSGALVGKRASDAFYVNISEEQNTDAVRQLGQVIIEIGVAPVRPAEFVIVRIAMWDGASQTNEG